MNKHNRAVKNLNSFNTTLIGGACVMALGVGLAQPAQAQSACTEYTIVSGDTLSRVAKEAGVSGGFQALFNANSNVLSNPNVVEIGQVLQIPCADGTLPGSSSRNVTPAVATPDAVTTSTQARSLNLITGTGYAPFTDEDLENGGALFEMVERALVAGNPEQDFRIMFVNDWGAHIEELVPTGAVDGTFPWFRPDCSKVEFLSETSAKRCTLFNHSDPLYEAVVGYYTLKDSPYAGAKTYEDIQGSRLCRPEAWFTFDLEGQQLMPPNTDYSTTPSQDGCWQRLIDGEVDVVTYDALPAEEDYRTLGLENQVMQLDELASKQTLHVFVGKDNEYANEVLPIINAGLEELRLSGEWFQIVNEGILATLAN